MDTYLYKGNRDDRDRTTALVHGDQRAEVGQVIKLSADDFARLSRVFVLEALASPAQESKSGSTGTVKSESSPSNKR